ncbi:hypothetical protein BGZ65_012629 [Modicella reniformis]|uniref:Uncharacterized protein n=1 Tax=Modicella reniformis TaxID=1440133 RepID=A0A9P6MA93_9FUNG|nr:hypothetical protein BGZ65_012629 [Modicella reniformis]
MPESLPSNSPIVGEHSVMGSPGVESCPYQQPQYSQDRYTNNSYTSLQRPPFPHRPASMTDDWYEILIDPYFSDLSSSSESSTFNSGRNSIDRTVINSDSRWEAQQQMDFDAHFSNIVRSTHRNVSSERPVIENYIENDDYQFLLAAVSSIRMSPSQSPVSSAHPDSSTEVDQESTTHGLYETQGDPAIGTLERQNDADIRSNPSSSAIDNIYDIRHIMIHDQRQHQDQIHQMPQTRSRQTHGNPEEATTTQGPADRSQEIFSHDALSTTAATVSTSTSRDMDQSLQELYLAEQQHYADPYMRAIFPPRPTISSSYSLPSTESTIMLSPPPSHPEYSATNGSSGASQSNNGPYTPYVTGRELVRQRLRQQEYRQDWDGVHRHSVSDSSDSELNRDDGLLVAGEGETGYWSVYGSTERSLSSFEQHRYQHYRREQQRAAVNQNQGHAAMQSDITSFSHAKSVFVTTTMDTFGFFTQNTCSVRRGGTPGLIGQSNGASCLNLMRIMKH